MGRFGAKKVEAIPPFLLEIKGGKASSFIN
jgi:hypothetical protein